MEMQMALFGPFICVCVNLFVSLQPICVTSDVYPY